MTGSLSQTFDESHSIDDYTEIDAEQSLVSFDHAEDIDQERMQWPKFFVNGHSVDDENFVPAYYRVDGPNGPVHFRNPGNDVSTPMTMYGFAMEMRADDAEVVFREDTPWSGGESVTMIDTDDIEATIDETVIYSDEE